MNMSIFNIPRGSFVYVPTPEELLHSRVALRLTYLDLQQLTGISRTRIRELENRKFPMERVKIKDLIQLNEALNFAERLEQ